MRIYIAGPMTGVENYNFPEFWEAAERLQALGHSTENPADNDGDTLESAIRNAGSLGSWENYLRHDLTRLVKCDAIYLLDGFDLSKGATLEAHVAERLGMPFYDPRRLPEPVSALIVGLSGYARSGKDTVAKTLVEEFGFERIAFADKVRDLLAVLNDRVRLIVSEFGWEEAKKNPTVREGLQRLGEGVRNVLGEDAWVDAALAAVKPGGRYVVTDVRYPNELARIEALGGFAVRVQRLGFGPVNGHVSETALDGYSFDEVIENSGSLDDLTAFVRSFAEQAIG